MCACVYMFMCVHECAHECGSQRLMSHTASYPPSSYFWKEDLSLGLELLIGRPALIISLPPFLRCYHICSSNGGDGGSKLTQPCLHGKYLTGSSILYGSIYFSHTYPSLRSTCTANVLKSEQMEQFTNAAGIIKKLWQMEKGNAFTYQVVSTFL